MFTSSNSHISQDTPLSPIVLGNTSLTDEDADCFYMSDIPHLPATRHNPSHERGNIPSQEKRHPLQEKRHPSHERRQSTPKEASNEKRENACLTPSLSTSSNDSYSKVITDLEILRFILRHFSLYHPESFMPHIIMQISQLFNPHRF